MYRYFGLTFSFSASCELFSVLSTSNLFIVFCYYSVVDCGPAPSITNGSPGTPDMTTFGGTVTYTCDNGFTLSGSAMITCLATGSWSTPPSCTGVLIDKIICVLIDCSIIVTPNSVLLSSLHESCYLLPQPRSSSLPLSVLH